MVALGNVLDDVLLAVNRRELAAGRTPDQESAEELAGGRLHGDGNSTADRTSGLETGAGGHALHGEKGGGNSRSGMFKSLAGGDTATPGATRTRNNKRTRERVTSGSADLSFSSAEEVPLPHVIGVEPPAWRLARPRRPMDQPSRAREMASLMRMLSRF